MIDRRVQIWIAVVAGLALGAALAVALLRLGGTYIVMASPAPSARLAPGSPGGSSSAAEWSSGWTTVPTATCRVFSHDLRGNPDDYAVELWFRDWDDGWGLNRRYYGGLEDHGAWYGVHWQELTANTIKVCRKQDDDAADQIRIRVWDALTTPDYYHDSGWTDVTTGTTPFTHSLGITETDLTVSLWFSGTARGIHHFGYGGLAVDGPERLLGAHWHSLTTDTIQVTRHRDDTDIEQVRVLVAHGDPPDYDSLEALGDWQSIDAGDVFTFEHNLNWNPNMLLVRGECYSPIFGGIHQWFAGGNHDWNFGWQGTNLQRLTENTVAVARRVNDQVCPQVHVRIWKRSMQVYLPLVVRDD